MDMMIMSKRQRQQRDGKCQFKATHGSPMNDLETLRHWEGCNWPRYNIIHRFSEIDVLKDSTNIKKTESGNET